MKNLLDLLSAGCEFYKTNVFSIYTSYENADKLRKLIPPKIICIRPIAEMTNTHIWIDFDDSLLIPNDSWTIRIKE